MKPLILATTLALASVACTTPALAQTGQVKLSLTGQPSGVVSDGRPYHVDGYRNARFGMTPEQVSAVIAADFPAAAAAMKQGIHALSGLYAIVIVVPALAPGPGPATVTYVFGADSKRLIAVNTYWIVPGVATAGEQAQLSAAATALTAGLLRHEWPFLKVSRGFVIAPGTLVMFAGEDEKGGGVEVRLIGTAFKLAPRRTTAGEVPMPAMPPGPAKLLYSVVANARHPDVPQRADVAR